MPKSGQIRVPRAICAGLMLRVYLLLLVAKMDFHPSMDADL